MVMASAHRKRVARVTGDDGRRRGIMTKTGGTSAYRAATISAIWRQLLYGSARGALNGLRISAHRARHTWRGWRGALTWISDRSTAAAAHRKAAAALK